MGLHHTSCSKGELSDIGAVTVNEVEAVKKREGIQFVGTLLSMAIRTFGSQA